MDYGAGIYRAGWPHWLGGNDAIVLIDFMNKQAAKGIDLMEAVLTAGHLRMRPIIMTTVTTLAGLLLMALGYRFQYCVDAVCHRVH